MSIQLSDNETKKLDCHVACAPRNDGNRHPELADCELRAELDGKMAKPLQTSIADPLNASNQAVSASQTHPNLPLEREGTRDFTLAPLGRGIEGEGLINNEIFRSAQDDKSS